MSNFVSRSCPTLIPSPAKAGEGGEPSTLRARLFTWELT